MTLDEVLAIANEAAKHERIRAANNDTVVQVWKANTEQDQWVVRFTVVHQVHTRGTHPMGSE